MNPNQTGRPGWKATLADIYHERTDFGFIAKSRRWLAISGTLIVIALLSFALRGFNLGIDFNGGSQWQFDSASKSITTDGLRTVMSDAGQPDAKILLLGSSGARIQTKELTKNERTVITDALAKYTGVAAKDISTSDVGPTWGDRVSKKALIALAVMVALIALYLTLRFEAKMAGAALIAVVHDIVITAGVYALTQFEVTPATVIAFLTILGFSLYDTVVVFDKVQENEVTLGSVRGDTYSTMVNRSLNQVLMRSINTSFVAVLPVFSLLVVGGYVMGAVSLRDFALALTVGLTTGAYSSIFVATPLLAWFKEREPKYRILAERSATQLGRDARNPVAARAATSGTGRVATLAPEAEAAETDDADETDVADDDAPDAPEAPMTRPSAGGPASPIQPRPRKQRNRTKRR